MSTNEDLNILLPDVTLTLDGASVKVQEYRFVQGMQAQTLAKPLLDDLAELFLQQQDAPGQAETILNAMGEIWGRHPQIMIKLLAMSVNKPDSWVESLDDGEGQTLLLTWWNVNRDFFARRLTTYLVGRRENELSVGLKSSPA